MRMGDGGDPVCEQPVAQFVEVSGKSAETADGAFVEVGGNGGHEFLRPDVYPRGVGVDGLGEEMSDFAALFSFWHFLRCFGWGKVAAGAFELKK